MSSVDSTAESRDGSPALSDDTTTNNRSTPKEGKSLYRLYQLCFHLSIQQYFATPYVNQSTFTVHVHTCNRISNWQILRNNKDVIELILKLIKYSYNGIHLVGVHFKSELYKGVLLLFFNYEAQKLSLDINDMLITKNAKSKIYFSLNKSKIKYNKH